MLMDYHVHLEKGPYDLQWLEQFLRVAKARSIDEVGFSEHGYRFRETRDYYNHWWFLERQTESIQDYLDLLEHACQKGYPVKKSIELDYFPGIEEGLSQWIDQYPFDYVIGSIHWLDDWGFDLPEMKDRWHQRDIHEVYHGYFDRMGQLVASGLFDVIGHFDVIKVFGFKPEALEDRTLHKIEEIVNHIVKQGMCVEISTAGLRKPVGEIYPSRQWLQLFYEAGVPIALSSDAHRPEDVGADYDDALKCIREVGYQTVWRFQNRMATPVQLAP